MSYLFWIVPILLTLKILAPLEVFKKQFILPHFEDFLIASVNLKYFHVI